MLSNITAHIVIQSSVELWMSAAGISIRMDERRVGLNSATEAGSSARTAPGTNWEHTPEEERVVPDRVGGGEEGETQVREVYLLTCFGCSCEKTVAVVGVGEMFLI